jgi:hypothetical protein
MSGYVGAHGFRRAERLILPTRNVIAGAVCHVFSSRVDSTGIYLQPTSRMIHITQMSYNRGAAGDFFVLMPSADITPELTRAEHEAFNIIAADNDERDAIEASG